MFPETHLAFGNSFTLMFGVAVDSLKERVLRLIPRHRSLLKSLAGVQRREGREGVPLNCPVSKSLRGKKDAMVATTAGGYLDAGPAALKRPNGTIKPTAKIIGTALEPGGSMEAAQRSTFSVAHDGVRTSDRRS